MADPLSTIASLIAVAQLSGSIISLCYDYRQGLKDPSGSMTRLSEEVRSLRDVFENVISLVDGNPSKLSAIEPLARPTGPVQTCLGELKKLEKQLQPAKGWKALRRTLKWPLKEPELLKSLQNLERVKTTISLALSTAQMHVNASKTMLSLEQATSNIENGTKALTENFASLKEDKEHDEIMKWLSPPDPRLNHTAARDKRHPATCQWLYRLEAFSNFLFNSKSFLWLSGAMGCGKTVLSSSIIDHQQEQFGPRLKSSVLYFYFDSNDRDKQQTLGVITSFVVQLSAQNLMAYRALQDYYQRQLRGGSFMNPFETQTPTLDNTMEILKTILKSYDDLFIVVDAVDECADIANLCAIFTEIVSLGFRSLRIVMTCRQDAPLEVSLKDLSMGRVAISHELVESDIQIHIQDTLDNDPSFRKWPAETKKEIETVLYEGSNGMFRWVECQLMALRDCWKPIALRKALRSLPRTLEESYEKVLRGIDDHHADDTLQILKLMVAALRPMCLEELAEILAIDWDSDNTFNPSNRMTDKQGIFIFCPDLLIRTTCKIGDSTPTYVQLAHKSVRDFLISGNRTTFAFTEDDAHTFAAKTCLVYLLSIPSQIAGVTKLKSEYHLVEYASTYWIDHFRLSKDQASLRNLVLSLFNRKRPQHLINWCQVYNIDRPWRRVEKWGRRSDTVPEVAPAIYYASHAGLAFIVDALLLEGEEPDQQGGIFGFPLQAAAYMGRVKVVEKLLVAGANPNLRGGMMSFPILAAADRGHSEIIRLLIQNGARCDARDFESGTALLQASINGHEEAVKVLLDAGADPNHIAGKRGSPLTAASLAGYEGICRLLLEHGAIVGNNDGLFVIDAKSAAAGGHSKVLNLLIEHGAKPSAALMSSAAEGQMLDHVNKFLDQGVPADGEKYYYPLTKAAAGGSVAVVAQLLSHGANIDRHDEHCGTALQAASANGHEEVVRFLLDKRAQTDITGSYWSPALHSAAYYGYIDICTMLLDHDPPAEVNHPGARKGNAALFGTVLLNAAYSGDLELVKLILNRGGQVNTARGRHGTPLQAAAASNNAAIVAYLLEKGAAVNIEGGEEGTALEAAAYRGNTDMIGLLLQHGSNVNLRGKASSNFRYTSNGPLHVAALGGHAAAAKMLLLAGADPLGVHHGTSPFEAAINGLHTTTVRVLLEHGGIDPNKSFPPNNRLARRFNSSEPGDLDQTFPVRLAGRNGDIATMRTLIEAGADVNAASADGWTALLEAAIVGHYPLVLALLDEMGADINAQLVNGSRAIHLAAQAGSDACIHVLLDRGVDPNLKNADGSTPLHVAARYGNKQVMKTLTSLPRGGAGAGADEDEDEVEEVRESKSGLTPSELAAFALERTKERDAQAEQSVEEAVGFGRRLYGFKDSSERTVEEALRMSRKRHDMSTDMKAGEAGEGKQEQEQKQET